MKLLLVSNLLLLVTFLFRFNKLPSQIPLFYSRSEGEEQLADWWFIFLIPLVIMVFFFLNQYLKKRFFKEAELIAKLIDYFNIIIVILLTLIFIKIIFLIT